MRRLFAVAVVVVLSCAGLLINAVPAGAATATITVDSAADGAATPTNCAPTPVASSCTLRDAFAAASSGGADAAGAVEIVIDTSIHAISLTGGELDYDGGTGGVHALTVDGSGVTITTTTTDRFIDNSGGGLLTISGLTLTGANSGDDGGAIESVGAVTVVDSALLNNHGDDGGAIDTQGAVTITRSTLANNTADSFGGAIEGEDNQAAFITNSTIANNNRVGGLAGLGNITLVYATIAGNSGARGANIDDNGGVLASFGSVIALGSGGGTSCHGFGSTTSHGFNLEDDNAASCGFSTGTHDIAPGTASGLLSLNDYGGPGPTRLPAPDSALLDAIPVASCASGIGTDERGIARPQGSGCDIGAVEVAVPGSTPPPTSPPAKPISGTPSLTG
jgi:hypothetical protein